MQPFKMSKLFSLFLMLGLVSAGNIGDNTLKCDRCSRHPHRAALSSNTLTLTAASRLQSAARTATSSIARAPLPRSLARMRTRTLCRRRAAAFSTHTHATSAAWTMPTQGAPRTGPTVATTRSAGPPSAPLRRPTGRSTCSASESLPRCALAVGWSANRTPHLAHENLAPARTPRPVQQTIRAAKNYRVGVVTRV